MSTFEQLWHVHTYGGDRQNRANQEWWFENDERLPLGHCCLQFVIEGSVKVRFGSESALIPTGGAFFFYYGEDSAYGMDDDTATRCACEFMVFDGIGLREHFALMSREFGNAIAPKQAKQLSDLVHALRDRACQHLSDDHTISIPSVYNFIGSMFAILEQGKDTSRKPVDKAIHRIATNPLYPWSIKEVVAEAGCSREHFTRVFHERFDQSPADWLNQQRVKHALYLLGNTFMTVSDIAIQAGFSSTHTMARLIKQDTGKAPSQLRAADLIAK